MLPGLLGNIKRIVYHELHSMTLNYQYNHAMLNMETSFDGTHNAKTLFTVSGRVDGVPFRREHKHYDDAHEDYKNTIQWKEE